MCVTSSCNENKNIFLNKKNLTSQYFDKSNLLGND